MIERWRCVLAGCLCRTDSLSLSRNARMHRSRTLCTWPKQFEANNKKETHIVNEDISCMYSGHAIESERAFFKLINGKWRGIMRFLWTIIFNRRPMMKIFNSYWWRRRQWWWCWCCDDAFINDSISLADWIIHSANSQVFAHFRKQSDYGAPLNIVLLCFALRCTVSFLFNCCPC